MLDYMFMPFRRYAEFSGRSRRKEFWLFSLLNLIIMSVLGVMVLASGYSLRTLKSGDPMNTGVSAFTMIIFFVIAIYLLAIFIPSIAVTVRRFHDRDMSGWWYLGFIVLSAIPFVGFIASIAQLVIFCLPSTPGHNRFGADPRDPAGAEVFA